jgi:superoxide dismutase
MLKSITSISKSQSNFYRLVRYSSNISNTSSSSSSSSPIDFNVIQLPNIDRINTYKSENNGIPGLFSPQTLNDIWFNQLDNKLTDLKDVMNQLNHKSYIDHFTNDSLNNNNNNNNNTLSGNRIINQYKNLLESISSKFEDDESYLFDITASIYNLFYFLSSLKSNNINKIELSNSNLILKPILKSNLINNLPLDDKLIKLINKSFGSIDEFISLLTVSANSIKGNGNTWLVYKHIDSNIGTYSKLTHLAILNTYNNGIPHTFTSNRIKNGRDFENRLSTNNNNLNNNLNNNNQNNNNQNKEFYANNSIPSLEDALNYSNNEFTFTPLFAIGSNPSFYLRDYGVYGKKLYIHNVINSIDWNIIADRIPSRNDQ